MSIADLLSIWTSQPPFSSLSRLLISLPFRAAPISSNLWQKTNSGFFFFCYFQQNLNKEVWPENLLICMHSSDMHLASPILDPLCLPQAQYQSKFYPIYSISCKENTIAMPVDYYLYFKTTWSLHIGIRPRLAGHLQKKDQRSIWSQGGPPVQYGQEICSSETSSSESRWTADPWKVGENTLGNYQYICYGLLSKTGQRVSGTFAHIQYSGSGMFTLKHPWYQMLHYLLVC